MPVTQSHRFQSLLLGLPVVATALLGVMQIDTFQVGSYHDDAWYIAEATALATGQGYIRPWTPSLVPENFLPFGYPLVLVPLRWLLPESFLPLQCLSWVAIIATVALCGWYYRRRLDWGLAWLVALLVAVNVGLVRFSTLVMSEAVYTLLSVVVLVLVERSERNKALGFQRYLAIGFVATYAYFVRTVGIALIGAAIVYLLLRRQWRGVVGVVLPFIALNIVWIFQNTATGAIGVFYNVSPSTLIPFVESISQNWLDKISTQWLQDLPNLLLSFSLVPTVSIFFERFGLGFAASIVGVLVTTVIGLGYWMQLRKEFSVAEFYFPAYTTLITFAWLDSRYWLPVTPLLVLYLTVGLESLASKIPRISEKTRLRYGAVSLALIALILLHLSRDVRATLDPIKNQIPDVAIGARWISRNTSDEDVIMAQVPRVTYLYSNRKVVPFPEGGSEVYDAYPDLVSFKTSTRFYEAICKRSVRYVLVEPELVSGLPFHWSATIQDKFVPILETDRRRFQAVYSDSRGLIRVYRVLAEGSENSCQP